MLFHSVICLFSHMLIRSNYYYYLFIFLVGGSFISNLSIVHLVHSFIDLFIRVDYLVICLFSCSFLHLVISLVILLFCHSFIESVLHSFTDSHCFSYGIPQSLLSDLSPSSSLCLSLSHFLSLSPSSHLQLVSVYLCISLSPSLSLSLVCSSSSSGCCQSVHCRSRSSADLNLQLNPGLQLTLQRVRLQACSATTQGRVMWW